MPRQEGIEVAPGARLLPEFLDREAQCALLGEIRAVVAEAPLYRPVTPRWGRPFSVEMTNCGPLGWVSDRRGYRYQPLHPETGRPWPAMPARLAALWTDVGMYPHPPEACLVNFYRAEAKMGLHQDRDEADFDAPLVSISLGDDCRFRLGGTERSDPTRAFRLGSGDVLVLAGPARLAFHGVDRILPGTSTLLSAGGRINLTLRRVTKPTGSTA